jgi:Asp-tRNA(Asn)/Glu-tRNA(Gln) amidotransferase B subunit
MIEKVAFDMVESVVNSNPEQMEKFKTGKKDTLGILFYPRPIQDPRDG